MFGVVLGTKEPVVAGEDPEVVNPVTRGGGYGMIALWNYHKVVISEDIHLVKFEIIRVHPLDTETLNGVNFKEIRLFML